MNREVGRDNCEDKNMAPFAHLTRITNTVVMVINMGQILALFYVIKIFIYIK